MAKLVLEARDEYVRKKKNRVLFLKRASAITFGAAAVLGIGIFTHAMKPPKKPTPSQSGIIGETETTSAVTTAAPTSPSTTTPRTTTAVQTTAATTAVTTASARQSVTTVRTTVTAARTTRTAVTTTAVTSPLTTTAAQMTGAAVQTTAAVKSAAAATTELPATDIVQLPWKRVVYGEKKVYRMCCRDNEQITAAAEDIGEYYGEAALMIDDEESTCQLYAYKNYSPTYVCAVKETEDSEPKLYSAFVKCDTLGELLEATDFENTVVIKEAYKGFIGPEGIPFEKTPIMSNLMKVLSDTSRERSDTSLTSTRSYTLAVEIPELGVENGFISILRGFGETGYISFDVYGVQCTYNIGAKKLDEFIRTFDENYSPEIKISS